jgi:hypothetical protein
VETLTIQTTNARNRICVGKRAYLDAASAEARGRLSLQHRPKLVLWVYKCPLCNWHHLTKKPQPNAEPIKP